jgi:2,3-bisphosphoglycerate-independent phosphoglycerate mutase
MNELGEALVALSVELKTLAKEIKVISQQVDRLANQPSSPPIDSKTRKTPPKNRVAKKIEHKEEAEPTKSKDTKTASEIVYELVKKSDNGADYAYIEQNTGYKKKKISNILFNLKRQGKIKSVKKGVYSPS